MKIIIPHCVEIVTALLAWPNQFRFLALVFCDQDNFTRTRRFARCASDRADDVFVGRVFHFLRRIEPETVEMKFLNPIATVSDKELAHRTRVRSVKINRFTPIVFFVARGEVVFGKRADIVSIRTEVVINNIENHGQA